MTINNPNIEIYIDEEICEGGVYIYEDDILEEEGNYEYNYISHLNCDSIVHINLTIIPESKHSYLDTICFGEFFSFGAIDLSLPGLYYDTLSNSNGCDSLIVLDLIVGQNLSHINVEHELIEEYGNIIFLNAELNGESLISNIWTESDSLLSNTLELQYLLTEDGWIFFESINGLFCIAKDSLFVKSTLDKKVYIPNIISPNGDYLNDRFYLGADKSLASSKLIIYDRWGNAVYEGETIVQINEASGWDGTIDGVNAEIGCYTYVFELAFINGDKEIRYGSIQLIR